MTAKSPPLFGIDPSMIPAPQTVESGWYNPLPITLALSAHPGGHVTYLTS